jgi:hypothetical protein
MGIDIYARWQGQTPEEDQAQIEAWLTGGNGHIGYLREAYNGGPYATRYLVSEAFENENGAAIPAATLRSRLPETLRLAEVRERTVYHASDEETKEVLQSYIDFVELCERIEKQTGKPVQIEASY